MPDPTPSFPSKSEYHHYYGHSSSWTLDGGPPGPAGANGGPNVPTPDPGDLFFNDNFNAIYVFDGANWVKLGLAAADHQTQEIIIGNNSLGDSLNNVDYLGDLFNAVTTQYGYQDAINSVDGNAGGANIYVRRGTYSFTNNACMLATYDAPFQLSQLLPSGGTGPLTFEGAGLDVTVLENNLTVTSPTFIFDHPDDEPVLFEKHTIIGSGTADSAINSGSAAVLIGNDGRGPSVPLNPAYTSDNVTFNQVKVDALNPSAATRDARAVLLCNDGVNAPLDNKFVDSIFTNGGNSTPPVTRAGCFEDNGVLAGLGSARSTFEGCRFINGANDVSGYYALTAESSKFINCRFGISGSGNDDAGAVIETSTDFSFVDCTSESNAMANFATYSGGFCFVSTTYIRMSGCLAQNNTLVGSGGWNYYFEGCSHGQIGECQAVAVSVNGIGEQNGFQVENGSEHITFDNCEAYSMGAGVPGPTANFGFGFVVGTAGVASSYIHFNDCTSRNCDDVGCYFGSLSSYCQIVGGTHIDNFQNGTTVVGAGDRVFSAAGVGTQNVQIDTAATGTTEAVHFIYN